MYIMQIWITDKEHPKGYWASVRPSKGMPYKYKTKSEAERMLDICYPSFMVDKRRVKRV